MSQQHERVPHKYTLQESVQTGLPSVALQSTDADVCSFDFTFEAVRPGIFRTTFTSPDHPLPPFPSAPRLEPAAANGSTPKFAVDAALKRSTINVGDLRAVVEWSHAPVVSIYREGIQKPLYRDLNFRSYAADGKGVAHYTSYKKGDLYVGLGEKAAPMNLDGRSFKITASDTFGYDAYHTDPLYKHIPLLIHVTPNGVVGIFSTTHARGTWCVGSEIDGMWGHFKVYRQTYGGLEQYLLVGSSVAEVVRLYADVVGYPMLAPRYMMGYISGGMKYTMEDDPRAYKSILNFIDKCNEHDIPVSAFQMSSGYTIAETEPKTRNVFTWNYHRFPDPRAFTAECHKQGVRLLANIKPYILDNHPDFPALVKNNAFFKDPETGGHGVARLWSAGGGESGEGAHIDFTSKFGFDWWYKGCKSLREIGIDAMWNDNNEYNIFGDDWELALDNVPKNGKTPKNVGLWGRAMHTELMGKSSHDACVDVVPDERPLVLTRSATAGTMRYCASTWSGDNVTSWDGMKGANAISLAGSFSLLHCYGHDIGGFEGPQPTPELHLRWIQMGIYQPRFAINCYKTSEEDNLVGEVIEPWMHPSVTPLVRTAIKRRYELIPYTYSGALLSHLEALPSMRWTGWGYEEDPGVWTKPILEGDTQFWFGDSLLISGIYEPGGCVAKVYLPKSTKNSIHSTDFGFINTNAPYECLEAGKWHEISSAWYTSIPVLARVGGAVPVGKSVHTTSRTGHKDEDAEFPNQAKDDWRGVEIFPPPALSASQSNEAPAETEFTNTWLEDDGISSKGRSSVYEIRVTYGVAGTDKPITAKAEVGVKVAATVKGAAPWSPLWVPNGIDIILPVGEERVVEGAESKGVDYKGRHIYHIKTIGVVKT